RWPRDWSSDVCSSDLHWGETEAVDEDRWLHHGDPPDARPDLRRVAVLDPAVGSGAFLLGALEELTQLRCAAGERPTATVRRDVRSEERRVGKECRCRW